MPHSKFLALSKSDRSKMMWHFAHSKTRCSGCGTHKSDWDESVGGDRYAFIGDIAQCRGCQVKETKEAAAEKTNALKPGMRVVLRKPKPDEIRKANGR